MYLIRLLNEKGGLMVDIIKIRIDEGRCPICNKDIGVEYKIIEDKNYGKVRVCKQHKET